MNREAQKVTEAVRLWSKAEIVVNGTVDRLVDELQRNPWALLFSGHGGIPDGYGGRTLAFADDSGNMQRPRDESLVSILSTNTSSMRLIVLSGCETERLGKQLSQSGVQYVSFCPFLSHTQLELSPQAKQSFAGRRGLWTLPLRSSYGHFSSFSQLPTSRTSLAHLSTRRRRSKLR